MFNALFGSAALLHCAKFLRRFDDNRMESVTCKKKKYEYGWREKANIISKANVSTNCCISSEYIPLMDQQ